MKSWAVPKGPSLDPAVKRLAIHVEDHPIEYNQFEGTIPAGEYGGGTVMIWDYGTYTAAGDAEDPEAALRAGYRKGDFKFVLKGKRLKGSWVLVRTKGRGERSRQGQWLLIKHRDEAADPDTDPTEAYQTSARTGTDDGRDRRRTTEEEQPMSGRPSVGLADLEEVLPADRRGASQQPPRVHARGVHLCLEPQLIRGAGAVRGRLRRTRGPVRRGGADRRDRVGLPLGAGDLLPFGPEPALQAVEQHR